MKITAYHPGCAGCSGITATGLPLQKGLVAVDPTVIPLGTTVYVPGYGYAIAADTGGAVKGNIIDVGYPDVQTMYAEWPGTHYGEVYIGCQ